MKAKSQERGQALILITLAAVGLFGFAALAIDGSRVFSDRRHAQNAADTAVLAAALAKVRAETPDVGDAAAETAGLARAASNGFDASNSTVEINNCAEPGLNPPCEGMPAGAVLSEYIQVVIRFNTATTFARILGRDQVPSVVSAIAHVQGTSSTSTSGGDAMVGLKQSDCGICANGNVTLDINGSGMFSNSTSASGNCSMDFEGNGTYASDGGFTVANGGAVCNSGNVTLTGTTQSASPIPYPPSYNIPVPDFACSGVGSVSGNTVLPGVFDNHLELNGSGNFAFLAGNYCFNNGVTINGNINVTANNVNFRINASNFQINGNSTFNCTNMIVHGVGGTGIEFNGNGSNQCTGVTFYMQSGKVTWNGNVAQTFKAPTAGPYKGLLMYLPYPNSADLTINGNSGNQLTGSIIAPAAPITINGNSGTAGLRTQITGYFITLNGNSNTTINYDPSEQYLPPSSPSIQLTK